MRESIGALIQRLAHDPWREKTDFSADLAAVHEALWDPARSNAEAIDILRGWFGSKQQPCLFGRIAARRQMISYCCIRDADLDQGDTHVRDMIQAARRAWWRLALRGDAHAFVVWVLSRRIAQAVPNEHCAEVAKRICELYLLRDDIALDAIYHEDAFLKLPSFREGQMLKWLAGVNYFSAAGDKRWWHDHRIPGGMALSVNSVGHMVHSQKLRNGLGPLLADLGIEVTANSSHKIDDLRDALLLAMKTIQNASDHGGDRATWLREAPTDLSELIVTAPPADLPSELQGKDYCTYSGYYHTDMTLPSAYFEADVSRPEIEPIGLDFTYLFEDTVDNVAHQTMGKGVLIGRGAVRKDGPGTEKAWRMRGEVVRDVDYPAILGL